MADKMILSKKELKKLNSEAMKKFISFMYSYFTDPKHSERLKCLGLGRVSWNQKEIIESIKNSVIPSKFDNIQDQPHLVIGILKFLVNNKDIDGSTLLLQPNSDFTRQVNEICRATCSPVPNPENILQLQGKIIPLLKELQRIDPAVYDCISMLFNLCYQIEQHSAENQMTTYNIITSIKSILAVCGLQTITEEVASVGTNSEQLQKLAANLPFENAIFEAFINIFNKKERIMADALKETEQQLAEQVAARQLKEQETAKQLAEQQIIYQATDQLLVQKEEDLLDTISKANILVDRLLKDRITPEVRLTTIIAELDIITKSGNSLTTSNIDDTFAQSALPSQNKPPMPEGLEKKKQDILEAYLALLTEQRNVLQNEVAITLQTRLDAIPVTHNQAELDALNLLRTEISNATPEVKALLPGGSAAQLLARLDARRDPLAADITAANALQTRLDAIAASHNQAELDALNLLRTDIGNAAPGVQALLPGGSAAQLLARLDARREPLAAAIMLQGELARVARNNTQDEINILNPLLARANALILGAFRDQLVRDITARIGMVTQYLQQQAKPPSIKFQWIYDMMKTH